MTSFQDQDSPKSNMTSFSSLPNELIVEVWRQVLDPEAVESFALASKKIHALGRAFIEEHNRLRANFSSVTHFGDEAGSGPAETLKTLLLNPRAALYIQSFSVNGWRAEWEYVVDSEEPGHRPYAKNIMELFTQSIVDSCLVSEDEVEHWLRNLRTGNECVIHSLILTMLPNVRSLDLHCTNSSEYLLFDTIKRIAGSRDTKTLSRLEEVRLWPGDHESNDDFEWVRTFATLSSVKAIKAWGIGPNCDCDYDSHADPHDKCESGCSGVDENYDCYHAVCHDHRRTLPPKASAVEHLAFIRCIMNTQRRFGFLKGLRALHSFEYLSDNPRMESSEPKEIVDALRAYARGTLQTLRLRSRGADYPSHAGTLVDFDVMIELEIAYGLLWAYTYQSGGSTLVDALPRSIEKVHLNLLGEDSHYCVERDVLQMATDKAERLPNLKTVTMELDQMKEGLNSKIISNMKQKCEEVGIALNVNIESPVTVEWSPSRDENMQLGSGPGW